MTKTELKEIILAFKKSIIAHKKYMSKEINMENYEKYLKEILNDKDHHDCKAEKCETCMFVQTELERIEKYTK